MTSPRPPLPRAFSARGARGRNGYRRDPGYSPRNGPPLFREFRVRRTRGGLEPMTREFVSIRRQGRVAIVTFDRGNPLNALSVQAIEELTDAARDLAQDLEVSAVVLTTPPGSGFSAGVQGCLKTGAGEAGHDFRSPRASLADTVHSANVRPSRSCSRTTSPCSRGSTFTTPGIRSVRKSSLSSQFDDQPGCPRRDPGRRRT